ncbi:MAG: TIGR02757 family protein [Bacteroidia bacterium]|nr:TIGR02757 family protein [Bacteroidia bacterium]
MGKKKTDSEMKAYLDAMADRYNNPDFIEYDPISVPHRYSLKEDIEIAGLLAATISWGDRRVIVRNGHKMLDLMGESPYDFVMSYKAGQLKSLDGFVHRTFNHDDLKYFIRALRHIYKMHGGMEKIFTLHADTSSLQPAIHKFKRIFFEIPHPQRTAKHIPDPFKGSAAKKMNMLLRWLIRKDSKGVDFGIWQSVSPSILSCPLDVHSGNIARQLGLLKRKQNDAKAVSELDNELRKLDPEDPVKYDFALFGLGISGEF